jgi:hypothetical protein
LTANLPAPGIDPYLYRSGADPGFDPNYRKNEAPERAAAARQLVSSAEDSRRRSSAARTVDIEGGRA